MSDMSFVRGCIKIFYFLFSLSRLMLFPRLFLRYNSNAYAKKRAVGLEELFEKTMKR